MEFSAELAAKMEAIILPEDVIGRWELLYMESGDKVFYDTLQSNIYIQFFEDNTSEIVEDTMGEIIDCTWFIEKDSVRITSSSDILSIAKINDGLLCFEDVSTIMRFQRVSAMPMRTQRVDTSGAGNGNVASAYYDKFVGDWFSEESAAGLFIGYGDEEKQDLYGSLLTLDGEYSYIEFWAVDEDTISGLLKVYGSEPILTLSLDYDGYGIWGSISYKDSGREEYTYFTPYEGPAYQNPYYTG